MVSRQARFALNHMTAPAMGLDAYFKLAAALGMSGVEIRNDLAGKPILDGTPASSVRELAATHGLPIVSINALQRFNEWNEARAQEARELAEYAAACGAAALVLVPTNDGSGCEQGERQANLRSALRGLKPILEKAGIRGLVEPLGFETCSLRFKSEAVAAIADTPGGEIYSLVHDTFHHFVAGEATLFPAQTGLVHISGVEDKAVARDAMRDSHRVLVGPADRVGNIGQITKLLAAGCQAPLSFEPFAEDVHAIADIRAAVEASMAYVNSAALAD